MSNTPRGLAERLADDQFAGYAYAYPHKTSYRTLDPAIPISKAWQAENKDSVFLYVHLPFCEMRCGFCNLFTTIQPPAELVSRTIAAIDRQSKTVASEVEPRRVTQVAFGGGTPSYLSCEELSTLFDCLANVWPIDNWNSVPISFEVSPATVDDDKLRLLKSRGIDRISMGVQSFSPDDLKGLGRPQTEMEVRQAIAAIQDVQFPVFNLDLIYGSTGQSMQSWLQTVEQAIAIRPEELYLYPLYVRDLTGLGKTGREPSDSRRNLFLAARDLLLANGYRQRSMRLFRRSDVRAQTQHCCQEDGMVGLGPGARSYTKALHYSSEYAVGQSGVRRIIADFNARPDNAFAVADYGVPLDTHEQQRRYLIKSILQASGISLSQYRAWFGADLLHDFPELRELLQLELAELTDDLLRLNEDGLSWSDVIGPWLYSAAVTDRMEAFELV